MRVIKNHRYCEFKLNHPFRMRYLNSQDNSAHEHTYAHTHTHTHTHIHTWTHKYTHTIIYWKSIFKIDNRRKFLSFMCISVILVLMRAQLNMTCYQTRQIETELISMETIRKIWDLNIFDFFNDDHTHVFIEISDKIMLFYLFNNDLALYWYIHCTSIVKLNKNVNVSSFRPIHSIMLLFCKVCLYFYV